MNRWGIGPQIAAAALMYAAEALRIMSMVHLHFLDKRAI